MKRLVRWCDARTLQIDDCEPGPDGVKHHSLHRLLRDGTFDPPLPAGVVEPSNTVSRSRVSWQLGAAQNGFGLQGQNGFDPQPDWRL